VGTLQACDGESHGCEIVRERRLDIASESSLAMIEEGSTGLDWGWICLEQSE
jgi:hypothetical protein